MADLYLNVSAIRRRTRVNGPGWRAAVWVQGCSIRCPGCFNPHTHPHQARTLLDPEILADQLVVEPGIEGISILGGEPFEQAAACARLAERARSRGASVVTYSGYTSAYLRSCALDAVQALLAATDLLVAGPFQRGRANDGQGWHGSTNQELVFLTDRYDDAIRDQFSTVPVVEIRTDGTHGDITGIPTVEDIALVPRTSRRDPMSGC